MPYCSKCGKPIREDDSFCQTCGNRIMPLPAGGSNIGPPTLPINNKLPPVRIIVSGPETTLAVIPDLMRNKALGLKDSFYLIVTETRSIFIKLTAEIMQKSAQYNLDKNPTQNKSMWNRWKAQVAGPNIYLQYLSSLPPEQALRESNENFALDNAQIIKVNCKYYYREDDPSEWYLEFLTGAGTHKFVATSNPEKLLKAVYANKLGK